MGFDVIELRRVDTRPLPALAQQTALPFQAWRDKMFTALAVIIHC